MKDSKITTIRMPAVVLDGLSKKAARVGLTRSQYINLMARRELGLPLADVPACFLDSVPAKRRSAKRTG